MACIVTDHSSDTPQRHQGPRSEKARSQPNESPASPLPRGVCPDWPSGTSVPLKCVAKSDPLYESTPIRLDRASTCKSTASEAAHHTASLGSAVLTPGLPGSSSIRLFSAELRPPTSPPFLSDSCPFGGWLVGPGLSHRSHPQSDLFPFPFRSFSFRPFPFLSVPFLSFFDALPFPFEPPASSHLRRRFLALGPMIFSRSPRPR